MRTMPHPCNSRKLVLTFDRATASVDEISSAGTGRGERNSSACTCATVRLIPHRVPISPQCKTNFCSTALSPPPVLLVRPLMPSLPFPAFPNSLLFVRRPYAHFLPL